MIVWKQINELRRIALERLNNFIVKNCTHCEVKLSLFSGSEGMILLTEAKAIAEVRFEGNSLRRSSNNRTTVGFNRSVGVIDVTLK
ncbi:MAG: hypothetical protein ACTS4W_01750 [Candidatus Hodgkinia cicadicola]